MDRLQTTPEHRNTTTPDTNIFTVVAGAMQAFLLQQRLRQEHVAVENREHPSSARLRSPQFADRTVLLQRGPHALVQFVHDQTPWQANELQPQLNPGHSAAQNALAAFEFGSVHDGYEAGLPGWHLHRRVECWASKVPSWQTERCCLTHWDQLRQRTLRFRAIHRLPPPASAQAALPWNTLILPCAFSFAGSFWHSEMHFAYVCDLETAFEHCSLGLTALEPSRIGFHYWHRGHNAAQVHHIPSADGDLYLQTTVQAHIVQLHLFFGVCRRMLHTTLQLVKTCVGRLLRQSVYSLPFSWALWHIGWHQHHRFQH
jgi:hypothetical protein